MMINGFIFSILVVYALVMKWYDVRLDKIEKRIIRSLHIKKEKKPFLSKFRKDKTNESND